ncbi:FkbM family methyltransferase [Ilumatobacter sp.]|uniref:FkbM family methyltransferase n=1 Tax=Ilumatobacter sp. TaxID=1967498 RepID=UPI003C55A410
MSYRIPLPEGGRADRLDLVDPFDTSVQRLIRRSGLASFEPETAAALLALFERHEPGFVLYDVGANVGVYSAIAAAMFRPAAVHAFEPSPTTAAMLSNVVHANQLDVIVHECALSDANGHAQLFLSPISDASNSMVEGFRDATGELTVETRRLDDVVAETGTPPSIIKIDVETHEPAVLAGARRTLEAHRPYLVIEVLYRSNRDLGAPIMEALSGLGYSYYALSASPDWTPEDRITGRKGVARDWLLAPGPLDDEFVQRWSVWHQRYLACDLAGNPRPPILKSARRAFERGGSREIVGTAVRFCRRDLMPSLASSARRVRNSIVDRVRRTG